MKDIYDYLLSDLPENALDEGLLPRHLDWERLSTEKPLVNFAMSDDGYIYTVTLAGKTPRELVKELCFYGDTIDPGIGSITLAWRLRALGYRDVEVLYNKEGYHNAVYTAHNGHRWEIRDDGWTGAWRQYRATRR